jgi:hypothetical protein
MLVVNCGVFALIRTGLNERFGDPSLTWFQVISALSVILSSPTTRTTIARCR